MKNEERAKRLEDERRLANETITALKAELAEMNGLYAETVSQFQAQTDRCEAAEQVLEGMRSAGQRVLKYGLHDDGTPMDWDEWVCFRAALNPAPQGGKP